MGNRERIKDEGGRMRDEETLVFHPSSFRLHPFLPRPFVLLPHCFIVK
jgi:hypothetical protein